VSEEEVATVVSTCTAQRVPSQDVDVLIVGGGPTGLTAANLLGSMGIRVLLVERNPSTSDDAKAISLDEESLRSLQLVGLDEAVYPIILPGTGTRYFGADGRALTHARGDGLRRFGHPFKNSFPQPALERVLRQGLDRYPGVEQRFGVSVEDLTPTASGVRASLRPAAGTATEPVDATYVLGCDGGRSTVRDHAGVSMVGRSFDEVWLVVDALDDPHDQRFGMHHGDPDRPHVIVPGRDGRCRYEFLLRPGEGGAGQEPPFALVQKLLGPYRDVTPGEVERAVAYRFHALLAEQFRNGRNFLLGDAAHMMPPFAGQGLNSGVRDATNLCWKIAEVLHGRARDELLDSYDVERRPHAKAVIDLSVRLGRVVMTTNHRTATLRDAAVRTVMRTPRGRQYLTQMRYRPSATITAGVVVTTKRGPLRRLVGSSLPQPQVLRGRAHELVRLDDVLGQGWALLGVDVPEAQWDGVSAAALPAATRVAVVLGDRLARDTPGRETVADADGKLETLLGGRPGTFVLVRPDRVVAACFTVGSASHVAARLQAAGVTERADGVRPDSSADRSPVAPHDEAELQQRSA